jgi:hypothetical protein
MRGNRDAMRLAAYPCGRETAPMNRQSREVNRDDHYDSQHERNQRTQADLVAVGPVHEATSSSR